MIIPDINVLSFPPITRGRDATRFAEFGGRLCCQGNLAKGAGVAGASRVHTDCD